MFFPCSLKFHINLNGRTQPSRSVLWLVTPLQWETNQRAVVKRSLLENGFVFVTEGKKQNGVWNLERIIRLGYEKFGADDIRWPHFLKNENSIIGPAKMQFYISMKDIGWAVADAISLPFFFPFLFLLKGQWSCAESDSLVGCHFLSRRLRSWSWLKLFFLSSFERSVAYKEKNRAK